MLILCLKWPEHWWIRTLTFATISAASREVSTEAGAAKCLEKSDNLRVLDVGLLKKRMVLTWNDMNSMHACDWCSDWCIWYIMYILDSDELRWKMQARLTVALSRSIGDGSTGMWFIRKLPVQRRSVGSWSSWIECSKSHLARGAIKDLVQHAISIYFNILFRSISHHVMFWPHSLFCETFSVDDGPAIRLLGDRWIESPNSSLKSPGGETAESKQGRSNGWSELSECFTPVLEEPARKKREEQKHNIPTKSRKESCQIQTTWPVMFINFEMFIGISCKLDDFSRRFRWGLPLRPEADENGWFNLAMIWLSFHRQTGGYASRVSAEARKNVAPNGGYATLATPASSWPLRFIDQNIYFNQFIDKYIMVYLYQHQ